MSENDFWLTLFVIALAAFFFFMEGLVAGYSSAITDIAKEKQSALNDLEIARLKVKHAAQRK